MTVKLLICDDDVTEIEKLKGLIRIYSEKSGVRFQTVCCSAREEILREIQRNERYEILFLDIYLEELNGVDLARLVRTHNAKIKLVFTSTSPLHALEAFGVNASQYLVKPVSYADLSQTLGRLLKDSLEGGFISVNCSNQIVKVFLSELVYTETQRHYQALFLADGTTARTRMTRAELCELLGPRKRVARVGASFLVNLDYVVRVAPDGTELLGDRVVHIPRRALAELKRQYFDYYCGGEAAEI